jgi:hypothetical protein
MSQEDIQDELKDKIKQGEDAPTPFEFLFINSYHSREFRAVVN